MWTVVMSGDAYTSGDQNKLVQPHPPQILVVLIMLGVGLEGGLQNHIAQVGTGEGKSVCLGTLATFFGLLDFQVNVVCYSPFLSERDFSNFKPLFDSFGVNPIYSDISELCNRVLRENFNVREMARKVLTLGAWTPSQTAASDTAPSDTAPSDMAPSDMAPSGT